MAHMQAQEREFNKGIDAIDDAMRAAVAVAPALDSGPFFSWTGIRRWRESRQE